MNEIPKKAVGAKIVGVLIQKMLPNGLEVIVGSTRDPTFGSVVMFGLGGIFVEVLKDVSFRVVPVSDLDADEMIKEIKGYKVLEGYRGQPPRDIEAIKKIIIKVSKLMEELEHIQDMDLNPIIVYERGKGAYVADARVIIKP